MKSRQRYTVSNEISLGHFIHAPFIRYGAEARQGERSVGSYRNTRIHRNRGNEMREPRDRYLEDERV